MDRILARFLLWLAAMILVPLAIIITLRAIDAYRWAEIGAVMVIALTTLTLRRNARDFIDHDETRGAVLPSESSSSWSLSFFSRPRLRVPLVKQHQAA